MPCGGAPAYGPAGVNAPRGLGGAPKTPGHRCEGLTVRLRSDAAAAYVGSPEAGPHLREVTGFRAGDHLVVEVRP
jgi:hypothetical protein